MKRVLVTGAAGFIGANLTRRLLEHGDEVHAVVRPLTSLWRLTSVREDIRLHHLDSAQQGTAQELVDRIRPDWVFHLAAHGAYEHQNDAERIVQDNIVATVRLLEACLNRGFEAFVNTGSSSEYGLKDHAPSESETLEPNSVYAVTKASVTRYCSLRGRQSGAGVVTLRPYSVYGPWEEPGRLFPALILAGLQGRLPLLTDPGTARDFVFIDDVLDAYILAARVRAEPGVVFNVGTGAQTTLRQLVALARAQLSIVEEPAWNSMGDRSWDTTTWVSDIRRIVATLGWSPTVDVAEGLSKTIDWFRNHDELHAHYLP